MKITICCVGKIKEKFYSQAIEEYSKRLSKYCKLEIKEAADEKTPDSASDTVNRMIKEKEGDRLLSFIKDDSYVIALAIDGKMLDSVELSEKIDNLKEYVIKVLKRELLFQEFLAVKDASFQIRRGEAWGLVGSNGSGKSTLLKAICGILKPYKGEIIVNGVISPLLELGAGFDQNLTARENIFLNGTVLGHSMDYMHKHFDEIVEFSELQDFLDSPIKNFSSGMRARLGFAIATIVRPDILIVDEILAVGDYAFQQKCLKRMDEMMSGGTTLIFVSHSIDQVRELCDHAVWINKGDIMQVGPVDEVCDAYMESMEKKVAKK